MRVSGLVCAATWVVCLLPVASFAQSTAQRRAALVAASEEPTEPYHKHRDTRHGHDHYYPDRGAIVRDLPVGTIGTSYAGVSYRYHDGVWLEPRGPAYMVVAPPVGLVAPTLPLYSTVVNHGLESFLYCNDTYYRPRPDLGGYEVVNDPVMESGPVPAPEPEALVGGQMPNASAAAIAPASAASVAPAAGAGAAGAALVGGVVPIGNAAVGSAGASAVPVVAHEAVAREAIPRGEPSLSGGAMPGAAVPASAGASAAGAMPMPNTGASAAAMVPAAPVASTATSSATLSSGAVAASVPAGSLGTSAGTSAPAAPAANPAGGTQKVPKVFLYPKTGQSADQQARDRYDCYRFAVTQSGFDPMRTTPNASAPTAEQQSDFDRAQGACFEGRGYSNR
jgi:hypothetical protein